MSFKLRTAVLSIFFVTSSLFAQSGHWEGTIQAAERTINIEFDLTKTGAVEDLRGIRDSPGSIGVLRACAERVLADRLAGG